MKMIIRQKQIIKIIDLLFSVYMMDFWNRPGAYVISSAPDGKGKPISRVGGIDTQGTLYIGGTRDLNIRLSDYLKESLLYRPSLHPVGTIYNKFPIAKELYPLDSLYVLAIPSKNPFEREKELKDIY